MMLWIVSALGVFPRHALHVLSRLFGGDGGTALVVAQRTLARFPISFAALEYAIVACAFAASCVWTARSRRASAVGRFFFRLGQRRRAAIAAVFLATLLGRLIMLNTNGAPQPFYHDEFAYLLAGDTYSHFRLTNPTPPYWHHFEAAHELMVPTYMDKYPPGQGLCLALGILLFHHPAAGVLLSSAALAAALCWQLQAMMPPLWALAGGLLCAVRIGTISYWSDSYAGGSMAALGGCLLAGSLVRLRRRPSVALAVLAACGCLLAVNCRPFEGGLTVVLLLAVFLWSGRKSLQGILPAPVAASFAAVMIAGVALMAYNNWSVTGSPAVLPYMLQTRQYGATPPLVFLKAPGPKSYRHEEERRFYAVWELGQYQRERTLKGYLGTLIDKKLATNIRFWLGPSLLVLLFGLPAALLRRKDRSLAIAFAVFLAALAAETWTNPHYLAPMLCVVYYFFVNGLRFLRGRRTFLGSALQRTVFLSCAGAFALRVFALPVDTFPLGTWAGGAPVDWGRPHVEAMLNHEPGPQLVLVSYAQKADGLYAEWVYNSASLDRQKILWAHAMAPEESDVDLECYFRGRQIWRATVYYAGSREEERYAIERLSAPKCAANLTGTGRAQIPGP